ncbi:cytochrome c oxidase assembly protein [Sphingomonas sp. STIS6.2]|uniref:cytochrome c oxidase assembly protein n=1 Tax=Sphingomonas sp. STIS6.2 TaxID=1379700 RepID=UPI0004DB5806|nr:cytochrome c oxidase assembly protein [Sphingomonas sp. STIS6.2]
MRRASLALGVALVPIGWAFAAAPLGMVGHMTGHMIAVAVAAPFLAYGIAGSRFDPAERWPAIVTPLAMSLVELVVVWLWHLPALRLRGDMQPVALLLEQASFLAAGLLLWSAVLGTRTGGATDRRVSGVAAMLLTSMHMTLLGALVGLAPRQLYAMMAMHPAAHGLDALEDQQLGGVVMLMVGAASYFLGGLAMLGGVLKTRSATA